MSMLTQEDLRQIESILYKPEEDELVGRRIFSAKTDWTPGAEEIGYDSYNRNGSATILAAGAGAKDVKLVGNDKVRHFQKVFTLATGFEISRRRLKAIEASNTLGKGPQINDETLKVETSRRFINELEDEIIFNGAPDHGIDGILTHPNIISNAATNGSWASATPLDILEDLRVAKNDLEQDTFFKARVLILDPTSWNILQRPFSSETIITIAQWLESQGAYFEQIVVSRAMLDAFNGPSFSSNIFTVVDNAPKNVQLAVVEDIVMIEPDKDFLGDEQFGVLEEFGGPMIRHPSAISVRTGV